MFIESAITSVVTPAATPITASSVTSRSTAGRFGDRRYRSATSHSNAHLFLPPASASLAEPGGYFCRAALARFRAQQRKQNHFADRVRIREQHHQPVDSDAFAGRRRQAVASARM